MLSPTRQLAYWAAALTAVAFSNVYFTHFSVHWLVGAIAATATLVSWCYARSGADNQPAGKVQCIIAKTLAFIDIACLGSLELAIFEELGYTAGPQRNLVYTLVAYIILAWFQSTVSGNDPKLQLLWLGNTLGPAKDIPTLTTLADKRYMGCRWLIAATLGDIVLHQFCFALVASFLRHVFFGDAMVCLFTMQLVQGHLSEWSMGEVFLGAPVRVAGDSLFKMVVDYVGNQI